ncbi:hypothetical protein [Sphingomonas sp. SRS2]|uniref:hypothetical protein n=1 Tax=Sphingomonas sp. SRS2 TaxID=133190 RepID=UPI0006184872|nr:hypothetical protein [Sphingomonas sp. SRS2]KKC27316.1 hypothetical protein WP12_03990 [Sphingomonas sp. SRS2]
MSVTDPYRHDIPDAFVVKWLRDRGLVGPISPDFIVEIREHIRTSAFLSMFEQIRRDPAKLAGFRDALRAADPEGLSDAADQVDAILSKDFPMYLTPVSA